MTYGDIITKLVFTQFETENLENKIAMFKEFRSFYERDKSEIEGYIKDDLRLTYSEKTLDTIRIIHRDIIRKILNRKTSGIYDSEPKRKLVVGVDTGTGKEKVYEDLDQLLIDWNWTIKMKEALKRALFFNTLLAQPAFRNNTINIDLITGDESEVTTDEFDYLIPTEVYLARYNQKTKEFYLVVWTEDDHFITDANGTQSREIDGKSLSNKYKILPFSVLRIEEGLDFWGEPNHNILQSQKEFDIDLTGFNRIEEYQSFGVWLAINTEITEDQSLSPNTIIKIDNVRNDMATPSLQNIVPTVQFDALRNNMDWGFKNTLLSEGLSGSTSDTSTQLESGVSKGYDEIEVQEQREHLKWLMWKFELDLFEKARIVWNAENPSKKIPEGEFKIEFSEEKPHETVNDKIARRKFELEAKINTEIDFIMEDKEVNREEAVKILAKNKGLDENISEQDLIQQLNNTNNTTSPFMQKFNQIRNNNANQNQK